MGNKSLTKRAVIIYYKLLLPIDGALKGSGEQKLNQKIRTKVQL